MEKENKKETTANPTEVLCPNCWGKQEYGTVTVLLENGEKSEQEELHCPNCWGKQEYDGKIQDTPLKKK